MTRDKRIDALDLPDADKRLVEVLGELRRILQPHKSPRCNELRRAIDDVAAEFTGDREFFHGQNHSIGKA